MISQSTGYDELCRFVHQECVKQRKLAVTEGKLVKIREILDANFGPENVDLSNIDEAKIIGSLLKGFNISASGVSVGSVLESMKRNARAKMVHLITIRFPEIEISNSRGRKHRIYDLYVRFHVTAKGRLVRVKNHYLYGIRTTGTHAEIRYYYGHSHLPRMDWKRVAMGAFCTGRGPINECCRSLSQGFDERAFTLFSHSLKSFIRWESLEGKPYRYITDIGSTADDTSIESLAFADVDQDALWNYFLSRISFLSIAHMRSLITAKIDTGRFAVTLSDIGKKYLIDLMEGNEQFNHEDYFALQTSAGQLVPMQLRHREPVDIDQNKVVMTFRHRPIKLKVIGHEHNINTEHRYLNPKVTDGFSKRLSCRFNLHFIRENALLPQCGSIGA
jgi:hypothetical protein